MKAIPARPALRRPWTYVHAAVAGAAGVAGVAVSLVAAPNLEGIAGAGLALLMITIAAIDARRFVIPDQLNIVALALALINAAIQNSEIAIMAIALAVTRAAVLSIIFLGLQVSYRKLRKRDGLGLGDVKLAGVAGAWLSWQSIPVAVEIAALAAIAAYTMRSYVAGRALQMTHRLPFGLFFAPAIWLGWLLQALQLTPS